MPLSETTLLKVAGDLVYARGEGYVRYVRGLRTTDFKAYASIQAKNVYTVELDWSGGLIGQLPMDESAARVEATHIG